jgi:hypothetical protein
MYSINSLAMSLDSSKLVTTSREKVFLLDMGEKKDFDISKYYRNEEETLKDSNPTQEILKNKEDYSTEKSSGILDIILRLFGIKDREI